MASAEEAKKNVLTAKWGNPFFPIARFLLVIFVFSSCVGENPQSVFFLEGFVLVCLFSCLGWRYIADGKFFFFVGWVSDDARERQEMM